ncbi:MAG: hypothetical protein QOG20_1430, partial [Pseudonocardiales bacterium]|nr:hypothetical protein [Pseudonocardiales bacterium]
MSDDQLQEYREGARAWLAGGRRTVRPLVDMTGGTPFNVGEEYGGAGAGSTPQRPACRVTACDPGGALMERLR